MMLLGCQISNPDLFTQSFPMRCCCFFLLMNLSLRLEPKHRQCCIMCAPNCMVMLTYAVVLPFCKIVAGLSHSLMATQVSEKLGVKSLRRMMLADSAATVSLGLHSVEAFGQSEALTTRLKHIIDDYADGPGVLMELLQNADDAGASEVAFMLDNHQYGTNSVLGDALSLPTLQAWSSSVKPQGVKLLFNG